LPKKIPVLYGPVPVFAKKIPALYGPVPVFAKKNTGTYGPVPVFEKILYSPVLQKNTGGASLGNRAASPFSASSSKTTS
jgi:hypothetical protein